MDLTELVEIQAGCYTQLRDVCGLICLSNQLNRTKPRTAIAQYAAGLVSQLTGKDEDARSSFMYPFDWQTFTRS